jgi:hypothetical protein
MTQGRIEVKPKQRTGKLCLYDDSRSRHRICISEERLEEQTGV